MNRYEPMNRYTELSDTEAHAIDGLINAMASHNHNNAGEIDALRLTLDAGEIARAARRWSRQLGCWSQEVDNEPS
jgi:hypothetical protein